MAKGARGKRGMSPEAGQVALVLIGSWAVVVLLAGAWDLWVAGWNRWVEVGPRPRPWPSPPSPALAGGLVLIVLWVYAYPAVVAGAALGAVYLAVVRRKWLQCLLFGLVTLGGTVAATWLHFGGPNHSDHGDGLDLAWPLATVAVPVVVMVLVWLLLGRHVVGQRRAASARTEDAEGSVFP